MKSSTPALPLLALVLGVAGGLSASTAASARDQDAPQPAASYRVAAAPVIRPLAWVAPVSGHRVTGRFGDTGSWSSTHTGLDLAVPHGTEIRAVAGGVVSEAAYDGAFGNKTVVTLPDGTEIWYCHQEAVEVAPGQRVEPGEVIGSVGTTGNTTGPHLHLEVHPRGGDPVDPAGVLAAHRVEL